MTRRTGHGRARRRRRGRRRARGRRGRRARHGRDGDRQHHPGRRAHRGVHRPVGRRGDRARHRGRRSHARREGRRRRTGAGAPPRAPSPRARSPRSAALGGFEIAALAGFIVGGAAARVPVVVDGVIADAALLVAAALAPDVLACCVAGHRSHEPGATAALDHLGLVPLARPRDAPRRGQRGLPRAPRRRGRGPAAAGDGHLRQRRRQREVGRPGSLRSHADGDARRCPLPHPRRDLVRQAQDQCGLRFVVERQPAGRRDERLVPQPRPDRSPAGPAPPTARERSRQ